MSILKLFLSSFFFGFQENKPTLLSQVINNTYNDIFSMCIIFHTKKHLDLPDVNSFTKELKELVQY